MAKKMTLPKRKVKPKRRKPNKLSKPKMLPKPVTIFRGSTRNYERSLTTCVFPACDAPGTHEHHITYEPPVTKFLCRTHHEQITIINGHKARQVRHSLSNKHRWFLWFGFLKGEFKARRTKKAVAYIAEWDS